MTRTNKKMLDNTLLYANEMLHTNITNQFCYGQNYLRINGENIFNGTKRECIEFLNGLVQFQLLNAQ